MSKTYAQPVRKCALSHAATECNGGSKGAVTKTGIAAAGKPNIFRSQSLLLVPPEISSPGSIINIFNVR
ncbi:MAG: hypothetical protein LAO78_03005 [Acidobacteriia bacterium]|nr:hypothetical protein [Terriglobia bacterium]